MTNPEGERICSMIRELATVYNSEGCGVWLLNAHKEFDGKSALDLIEEGRLDEVEAAVERLITGAHS